MRYDDALTVVFPACCDGVKSVPKNSLARSIRAAVASLLLPCSQFCRRVGLLFPRRSFLSLLSVCWMALLRALLVALLASAATIQGQTHRRGEERRQRQAGEKSREGEEPRLRWRNPISHAPLLVARSVLSGALRRDFVSHSQQLLAVCAARCKRIWTVRVVFEPD